jgi:hypothetical protein
MREAWFVIEAGLELGVGYFDTVPCIPVGVLQRQKVKPWKEERDDGARSY